MSIAILSRGPDYCDPVGNQILRSPYVVIVNCRTFRYDALRNPLALDNDGQNNFSFIQLMIQEKVTSVLVNHCAAYLKMLLAIHGIGVIESVTGKVGDVLNRIRKSALEDTQVIEVDDGINKHQSQAPYMISV